ncbi:hypothetical protein D5F01_LYC24568 [Larimichthys crocea]|uniref:C-type lectin domain-containing protein n=1 Tax=Larimichthys crocea TaxID=215358 RepID=A0A6G0HE83_LARCR|nr:hypothetical protein D5F01_LYC24568 [Larimichthys crocea]
MVDLSKMADIEYKHRAWIGLYDDLDSWRWSLSNKGSDVTFVLINKTMTWTEAQNYCRTNYTDLASVRNMTENQKIQDLKGTEDKVWIGLFRDSWKWLDGSNSSFSVYNKTSDQTACVEEDSGQDLNDPAVNEQMLEQLRQRLKDHGVNPDDVKLSWRKQADGKVFHKVEKKKKTEKKTKKTEL